ncbi:MAG TPA: hypothetical protein DEA88_02220 [Erwinia persicina]|nr:hypothetical protein [Erwinia persicina]HBT11976.1 hypothetical protein [Erwinia persicina]HBT31022.1 hypothetical protein [Erwinia persicina]
MIQKSGFFEKSGQQKDPAPSFSVLSTHLIAGKMTWCPLTQESIKRRASASMKQKIVITK